MPALIERPKMTLAMYQALKKHIIKEREKKKQELEQDAMNERQKKEEELRKKKEQENTLTLEQTKEQISQLSKKIETLQQEKHELFSQLKKVLHQEDETRKRAQQREQSELINLQPSYTPVVPSNHVMMSQGRPTLFRPVMPQPMGMKRPRSPTPPPTSVQYQPSYPESKIMAVGKQHPAYPHPSQPEYKQGNFPQGQAPPVTFASQQGSHGYQTPITGYGGSKSPAAKYTTGTQSAFTSYSHYGQQQKAMQETFSNYAQRLPQPATGYPPTHGTGISIQQQLEQRAGFNEDKYKLQQPQQNQIRPIPPQSMMQHKHLSMQQQQQQQQPAKGSIMTGYSGRGPPQPGGVAYPPTTNQYYYSK